MIRHLAPLFTLTLIALAATARAQVEPNLVLPSPPLITSITPMKTVPGSYFEIHGSGFTFATNVTFSNNISWPFSVVNDSVIATFVPAGAVSGPVTVFTTGGVASSPMNYTIIPGLIPNPAFDTDVVGWGQAGGAGPTGVASIVWNSADSGATPGSGSLSITNNETVFNGTQVQATSKCIQFTPGTSYTYGAMVFMASTEPAGNANTNIRYFSTTDCSGTPLGQTGVSTLPKDVWALDVVSRNFDSLGAVSGYLQLNLTKTDRTTTNHALFDAAYFDVTRPPSIASFSPASGPAGTVITILGADFYGLFPTVTFTGGATATPTMLDSGRMQVVVPAGANTGAITYSNINGNSVSGSSFTVIKPPTITAVTPPRAARLTSVTIDGTNLGNVTSVSFNGTSAQFLILSAGTVYLSTVVPSAATTGLLTVTNPAGSASVQFVVTTDNATADFNSDGKSDVIWRNGSNGQNAMWIMNGVTIQQPAMLPTVADTNWKMAGVGAPESDGLTDVIWVHAVTGQVVDWLMQGAILNTGVTLGTLADKNWKIAGMGDFDGDGKSDVVWRHAVTGQVVVWIMNHVALSPVLTGAGTPGTVADLNWNIVGIGDFNGDGKSDLFWRNASTGQNVVWLMNGSALGSALVTSTVSNLNYQVAGVGDANADGKADVFWRNSATGDVVLWVMNGATVAQGALITTVPDLNWHVEAVGDFDADGKVDLIWRKVNTGDTVVWLMNGTTLKQAAFATTVPDLNWAIVAPR